MNSELAKKFAVEKKCKILWIQPIIQADLRLIPQITFSSDDKMKNLFGISDFNMSFITKLITNNEPTRTLIYACLLPTSKLYKSMVW